MAEYKTRSTSYEIDEGKAVEFYYDRGWTDGLPIVPPTEEKVGAMLAEVGLVPNAQIAFIEMRQAAGQEAFGGAQDLQIGGHANVIE